MVHHMTELLTEVKVFNGANVIFVLTPDGEQLIPVKVLADYFEIPLSKSNWYITKNRDLFDGKRVKFETTALNCSDSIMGSDYRMKSIDCLTIAGAIQWINLLSHDRYSDDRRETIIGMKNWLVELGANAISGRGLGQVTRGEVRIISSELTKKLNALLKEKIVDKYCDGKSHNHVYQNEAMMLNRVCIGEHKKGMKETLNASGLQVHNTGQISDIALLHANVTDYHTRKDAVTATVNIVHSCVEKSSLRLSESDQMKLKRRIPIGQNELTGIL